MSRRVRLHGALMSVREAALAAPPGAAQLLHVKDITKRILARKLWTMGLQEPGGAGQVRLRGQLGSAGAQTGSREMASTGGLT